MFWLRVFLTLFAASWSPAAAQVYEWRDASGSRHFTNEVENIPDTQREQARVVVRAAPPRVEDDEILSDTLADAPAEESIRELRRRLRRERRERYEPAPERVAQVVYDNSFRFPRRQPVAPEVHVNIDGPLAVSQVIVPPPYPVPVYVDPGYDYYYEPQVSPSFDRGRYRHRTVRMRLQDQFQYDRNGPSFHVRGPVPLGPRFQATLPRGVRSCAVSQRRTVLRR